VGSADVSKGLDRTFNCGRELSAQLKVPALSGSPSRAVKPFKNSLKGPVQWSGRERLAPSRTLPFEGLLQLSWTPRGLAHGSDKIL
jgi:hypothetical protein